MNFTEEREALHALASCQAELDAARQRVAELTEELDTTNRGIIALHTQLDAAREAEAEALASQEVLADRDRIANRLHDEVIQRVFGSSLNLQGVVSLIGHPRAAGRVQAVIGELDATLRELRTAIFGLDDQPRRATSLRVALSDLIAEVERQSGAVAALVFEGPIDAVVPDDLALDLLAVTRGMLRDIASRGVGGVEVTVHADTGLILRVELDVAPGRLELPDEVRARMSERGGTVTITETAGEGASLEWRVPLPARESGAPSS
ncbi:sensor histidine kinase [Amycolatopsis samaneae]|uniref:Sensor histidine kinase n=1 Tax=Amycolatopsis samaneae TaxID=664691 RepID=A0ABW5GR66_9PSEU